MLKIVRQYAWVYGPSEVMATAVLGLFLSFALGAWFSCQIGASSVLGYSTLDFLLWGIFLAYLAYRQPPPFGKLGFLRGIVPWMALLLAYDLTGRLSPIIHPQQYDYALRNLDSSLWSGASSWGKLLSTHPRLIDLFCTFYLSLFLWLLGLLAYHLLLRRALYQRFMLGLMLVYVGGFTGYLLFPAVGPRFAYPQEWAALSGGAVFRFTNAAVAAFSSRIDVFPSLHGALSSYLFFWQWRQDKRGLIWGLPLMLGIWASTLLLGYHYLPDLASGILLALVVSWLAPRLERVADHYRQRLNPPLTWLTDLVEGHGDLFGKLAGRLSDLLPLGGAASTGIVFNRVPRNRGEEPLRKALAYLGEGPFWLRPSDESGSMKNTLLALKPLSLEQAVRTVFLSGGKKCFLIQKALKVTAVGLCRSFPSRAGELTDVEIRVTTLPRGEARELLLKSGELLGGRMEGPWLYYPSSFPVKGFALFELVQLTRKLAVKWKSFTEVEWVLSGGKLYVLDGRAVRQALA